MQKLPAPSLRVPAAFLVGAVLSLAACSGGKSTSPAPESGGSTGGVGSEVTGSGGAPAGGAAGAGEGESAGPVSFVSCEEAEAVVALTYDDGLSSQLQVALPALDERGIKATFFLGRAAGLSAWPDVRSGGHELGAHTLNHPCPRSNSWVAPGNASEDYDLERMATELDENVDGISAAGQAAPLTFAWPCGVDWVGETKESYEPLVAERFAAARGVVGSIAVTVDNPMQVPAYFYTGAAAQLTGVVDEALEKRGLAVFGFHGVGGDYAAVSAENHAALLDYLAEHASRIAVLPFGEAVACQKSR